MNELIAKIQSEYKNVLSQKDNIVDAFDLSKIEAIDFTPSHKLENEEWFRINNFSQQPFAIRECSNGFSTASLTQIDNKEYNSIDCIAILQENQKHFQRITPSFFVRKKTILDYSGEPKIVEHRKQIEIKKKSDAVYLVDRDELYFENISKIKRIFPGIEALHREATQPEVDNFLKNNFILLSDFTPTSVGIQNRKRIADIGEKFNNLNQNKKQRLITYAKEKAGVELEDGKFKIKSDTNLKKLLYAMDQRYYYADIYEENRIASSVRVVQ